jgi:SAM-dependent methyltransferase
MLPLLYRDLVPWYRLIDPYEDHLAEATCYLEALERAATPRAETLLDLGAGAGGNVYHLKKRFRCTLVDIAPNMSTLSRELNPECEHILGDMRTVRLGRQFDAVLVHDAIMYMTTEDELRAAIETAAIHTRSGGAAVFAPDTYADTFAEGCVLLEHDDGRRAMRGMEWSWDPDPSDSTVFVEYSFLLRDEHGQIESVHDRHTEGLFSVDTWTRLLEGAGFSVEMIPRPLDDEGEFDRIFLCRKQ